MCTRFFHCSPPARRTHKAPGPKPRPQPELEPERDPGPLVADYVIVGVGSAGCVLANRLSAKHSVIGIEAGPDLTQTRPIVESAFAGIEFGLEENFLPVYLWQRTPTRNGALTPTADSIKIGCNLLRGPPGDEPVSAFETVGIYSTGRILGGGSSINGLQFVKGSPGLFSAWAEATGDPRWGPERAYHNYRQIENYLGLEANPRVHGHKGPVEIRQAPVHVTAVASKVVDAVVAAGFPRIPFDDYNNPATPIGPFGRWQLFEEHAPPFNRADAAVAFLPPEVRARKTLTLLLNSTVLRVVFDSSGGHKEPRAVGVEILQDGKQRFVAARKEVLLCASIFNAEILQRSGIGPAPLLRCLGVPVVCDNANVGQNFTNHLLLTATFSINPSDAGLPPPDPQALYTGGVFLPPLLREDDPKLRGYQFIGGWPSPGVFFFFIIYLQPHSKGQVQIQNSDPLNPALVDNNYLADPLDRQAFVLAVRRYLVPIADQLHKIDPTYNLVEPSPDVIASDDLLLAYILEHTDHTHHWTRSVAMARSPATGVVDSTGRVFGVRGLRAVDVSIAPVQPDGNTCAPAYLIGWTIAKAILATRRKHEQ